MLKNKSLTSNIILFTTILLVIVSVAIIPTALAIFDNEVEQEEITTYTIEFIDTYDKNELLILMAECEDNLEVIHNIAEEYRLLGYSDNTKEITHIKSIWGDTKYIYDIYVERYLQILSEEENRRYTQYPSATKIWNYLKEQGYNDYVCAGILGNIMVECGGNTLNINEYAISSGKYFYGICQWNKGAYKEVWGTDLDYQCNFLISNIKYEFDSSGCAYKKGFTYADFVNMNDYSQSALAFAKCYERCGKGSYKARQSCAAVAYNYFVN